MEIILIIKILGQFLKVGWSIPEHFLNSFWRSVETEARTSFLGESGFHRCVVLIYGVNSTLHQGVWATWNDLEFSLYRIRQSIHLGPFVMWGSMFFPMKLWEIYTRCTLFLLGSWIMDALFILNDKAWAGDAPFLIRYTTLGHRDRV